MALLARFDESSLRAATGSGTGAAAADGSLAEKTCMRCKSNQASTSVRGEDVCKDCIVSYVSKRARNALTGLPQLGHAVAVCLGPGVSSALLLDHAQGIMHCGRKRRYWTDATAIHVHYAGISPEDAQASQEVLRHVLMECLRSGLRCVVVPVECGLPDGVPLCCVVATPPQAQLPSNSGPRHPLQRPFVHEAADVTAAVDAAVLGLARLRQSSEIAPLHGCFQGWSTQKGMTPDLRQHLLNAFTQKLCLETAIQLHVPHVLYGSCVDTLAEGVMTSGACGSGASVPCDVSPIDRRWMAAHATRQLTVLDPQLGSLVPLTVPLPSVWYPALSQETPLGQIPPRLTVQPSVGQGALLMRPFLEIERKEIQLYAQFRGLSVFDALTLTPSRAGGPKGSTGAINSGVLAGLQAAFPATLHNVVRTARKLALPWDEEGLASAASMPHVALCTLCHGVLPAAASGVAGGLWCARCTRMRPAWERVRTPEEEAVER